MAKHRNATTGQDELRRRAEARFSENRHGLQSDKNLSAETRRLVQELRVHQIELEMQNEELQRARLEVEEGLARYTELYELAPVGYLTVGPYGEIRQLNLSGARLLGSERAHLVGRRLGLLVAAESRPALQTFLAKVFESRAKQACELAMRPEGRAPLAVELTAAASQDGTECRVVVTDITERKRAEELMAIRLRLLEFAAQHTLSELLQKALDEVEQLTASVAGVFHFVEADQRTLSLRAHSTQAADERAKAEARGHKQRGGEPGVWDDCIRQRGPVVHNDAATLPRKQTLPSGAAVMRELAVPVVRNERTVAILSLANKATPFSADDVKSASYLADVAWEVAERRRAEREREELQLRLAQAQKMEAIGTLAGGIAHDFNNILQGLMGGLSLLEVTLTGEHRPPIQEMTALVQRGADLAKQLLGFARRGRYDVKPLNLARAVEKTSSLFGRTRKDIPIELSLAPDLRAVLMDHAQLEQVLLNLFVNAGQAMPEGGQLRVDAENVELSAKDVEPHGVAPGRFVKLVVADTGCGMDEATQARIFEPFFTTKGLGQGPGLGLASVYGIVKGHAGFVTVESQLGRGTRFTLWLPATDQPIAREKTRAAAIQRGNGTILVVDDELTVATVCSRLLQSVGYDVLIASSGKQAVELVRKHGSAIALVILDMIMPGMSGRQTYEALLEIAPKIKVLVSSGYSVEEQAQELLERGCNGFIQKPFNLAVLAAKVQALVTTEAAPR